MRTLYGSEAPTLARIGWAARQRYPSNANVLLADKPDDKSINQARWDCC